MSESTFGPAHPEWERRHRSARDELIPWIAAAVPLAGATVLEYGVGQGAVATALAPRVGRLIGIDIDEDGVDLARHRAAERGCDNVELQVAPAESIVAAVRAIEEPIDVVMLYAVIEHLTLEERLDVLTMARDVVRPGGHVVIAEAPNRLTPVDHHTAQAAYFDALPDDLYVLAAPTSGRTEFVEAIASARGADTATPDAGTAGVAGGDRRAAGNSLDTPPGSSVISGPPMAPAPLLPIGPRARLDAARWGRGVSFHEVELVFGDLADCTVASGYAAELYAPRPVRLEELQLQASMDAWRPDLPPAWSRSWIDTILRVGEPLSPRPPLVRPWRMRIDADVAGVAALRDDGRIVLGPGVRCPVRLPVATDELHVGFISPEDPGQALAVHMDGTTLRPAAGPNTVGVPPWHATVRLPRPTDHVELSLAFGGDLTYVGYAAPAGAPTGVGGPADSRHHGW